MDIREELQRLIMQTRQECATAEAAVVRLTERIAYINTSLPKLEDALEVLGNGFLHDASEDNPMRGAPHLQRFKEGTVGSAMEAIFAEGSDPIEMQDIGKAVARRLKRNISMRTVENLLQREAAKPDGMCRRVTTGVYARR